MAAYHLFVDDSGNREYSADRSYGIDGKSLHFVYGAILLDEREAGRLTSRLRELKLDAFKDVKVEIKSNWLRIEKERRERYLKPYNLSEERLAQFVDDYYQRLVDADLQLIGAVVNKFHMQEMYDKPPKYVPWYPPTAAYDVLMQRAVLAVPTGATLAVTIDNISGKTPNQNEYKDLLQRHHAELRARGSKLQPRLSQRFKCVVGPARFVFSEHSNLVQGADLVSYNVHRQFRDYWKEWEGDNEHLPVYPHFGRICSKFRTDGDGRFQGYGIVKFPLLKQTRWCLRK